MQRLEDGRDCKDLFAAVVANMSRKKSYEMAQVYDRGPNS